MYLALRILFLATIVPTSAMLIANAKGVQVWVFPIRTLPNKYLIIGRTSNLLIRCIKYPLDGKGIDINMRKAIFVEGWGMLGSSAF